MLRLIGVVVSIGLADSLNPSTLAPALYLAAGDRARARVTEFTIGVFLVYFLGGVAIALGPGQLLLSLVPHPRRVLRYSLEIAAGAAMLAGGAMLWRHRERLAERDPPQVTDRGKSSALLGATITALELPTAFPYFAVIAAIVTADVGLRREILLLVLFNICFVLPLIGIVATLEFGGDNAQRLLAIVRNFLERHWPTVLAVVALLAGSLVVLLGATGLAATRRGRFGGLARHFRHFIHP